MRATVLHPCHASRLRRDHAKASLKDFPTLSALCFHHVASLSSSVPSRDPGLSLLNAAVQFPLPRSCRYTDRDDDRIILGASQCTCVVRGCGCAVG